MAPLGLVYQKEFDGSGCYVRVPFGRFAALLAPQLAAPQSVAPQQPIDCLLQVYRVHLPLPLARLAQVEGLDDEADIQRFHVLTQAQARALKLPLRTEGLPGGKVFSAPAVVRPGQYLWSLLALFDPTSEAPGGSPSVDASDVT